MRVEQAQGILIAALGVLAKHYGYGRSGCLHRLWACSMIGALCESKGAAIFAVRLPPRICVLLLTAVLVVQLLMATQTGSTAMSLSVTSPAFANSGDIPKRHTCEGSDVSPPLAWSGLPEGTRSLALIVDDPDAPDPRAPKMTWVHWVLYNLPPTASALLEAVSPAGPERLEKARLRWPVPADRTASLRA